MRTIDDIMALAPVIPVLVIEHVADARPVAEALVAGGLPVLEVTLRTPAALDVIREMTKVKGAVVGAGTVLNDRDLEASLKAAHPYEVPEIVALPVTKGSEAYLRWIEEETEKG